jgi:RimJ/RimL family protein N-acetyltransferase
MPEVLGAALAWAAAQPGIWRVWSMCDAENRPSARTMEKAGMVFESVLRRWLVHPNLGPAPRDCRAYAWIREE